MRVNSNIRYFAETSPGEAILDLKKNFLIDLKHKFIEHVPKSTGTPGVCFISSLNFYL